MNVQITTKKEIENLIHNKFKKEIRFIYIELGVIKRKLNELDKLLSHENLKSDV